MDVDLSPFLFRLDAQSLMDCLPLQLLYTTNHRLVVHNI